MAHEQILRSWCTCPCVGDLTGVPTPAFHSSLTGYPWDTLKLLRYLIPGPRDAGLAHSISVGMKSTVGMKSL